MASSTHSINLTIDAQAVEDAKTALNTIAGEVAQMGQEIDLLEPAKFLTKLALGLHFGFGALVAGIVITGKILNIRKSRKYVRKGYSFIHLAARSVITGVLIGLTYPISLPAYTLTGKEEKIFKP